jgi:hypothetical protein
MPVLSKTQHRGKANGRHVYALRGFSVERRGKGWFFAPTVLRQEKPLWRGPYRSEASVTLVIARELKRELLRRHRRPTGTA